MPKLVATLLDPLGIHARPAARLVQVASKQRATITFEANGRHANARSITMLLALGARHGTVVTITVAGDDEEAAIAAVRETLIGERLVDAKTLHEVEEE